MEYDDEALLLSGITRSTLLAGIGLGSICSHQTISDVSASGMYVLEYPLASPIKVKDPRFEPRHYAFPMSKKTQPLPTV